MADWYAKGGSRYNEEDSAKLWGSLFLSGFEESDYGVSGFKDIEYNSYIKDGDPYWRLGGSGSEKKAEFGLWNNNRITVDEDGIGLIGDILDESVEMGHLDGSTYDTVEDWFETTQSAGVISGGDITDNGDGTITVAAGQGFIKSSNSSTAPTFFFDWDEDTNVSLTNNDLNYVYVKYNGGNPVVDVTVTEDNVDGRTEVIIGRVYREDTTLYIMNLFTQVDELALRIQKRLGRIGRFERYDGMVTSEVANLYIAITQGHFYYGLNYYTIPSFDSSGADTFTYVYRDGGGGWTYNSGQSQIDNTQYDDGTGALATLTSNRYGVHWVYIHEDGDVFVVYGRGDYKLAQAQAAAHPDTLPDVVYKIGKLVAKIIVQKNDTSFTELVVPWENGVAQSIPTDHGSLAGLTDDDHDQYLLVNGSRAMAGDLDLDANDLILGTNFKINVNNTYGTLGDVSGYAINLLAESNNNDGVKIGEPGGSPVWAIETDTGNVWMAGDLDLGKNRINSVDVLQLQRSNDDGRYGYIEFEDYNGNRGALMGYGLTNGSTINITLDGASSLNIIGGDLDLGGNNLDDVASIDGDGNEISIDDSIQVNGDVDIVDTTPTLELYADTDNDAVIRFKENNVNKGLCYWDASHDAIKLYNYAAGSYLRLTDTGELRFYNGSVSPFYVEADGDIVAITDQFQVFQDGADVELLIHEDAGTHDAKLHIRRGTLDWYIGQIGGGALSFDYEGTIKAQLKSDGDFQIDGDLQVDGNDIKDSGGNVVFSFDGSSDIRACGSGTPNGDFDVYSETFTHFTTSSDRSADGNGIGGLSFYGRNDAEPQEDIRYGSILCKIGDASDGTEDGYIEFYTMRDGSLTEGMQLLWNGNLELDGDLKVGGNDIKDSGDNVVLSFDGIGNIDSIGNITQQFPTFVYEGGYNPIRNYVYTSSQTYHRPDVVLYRARNTQSSPQAVQNGDDLGQFRIYGYDGNSWEECFTLRGIVNGAVSDENIPTEARFRIEGTNIMTLDSDGLEMASGKALKDSGGNVVLSFDGAGGIDNEVDFVNGIDLNDTDIIGVDNIYGYSGNDVVFQNRPQSLDGLYINAGVAYFNSYINCDDFRDRTQGYCEFHNKVRISSSVDGKLELQTTTEGGTGGTPEGGWNYIEFLDSDGDRQGYFGIDSAGNFQFSPEVSGGIVETASDLDVSGDISVTGTVDGIDVAQHNHDGTVDDGAQIDHGDLLNMDQHDHTQYLLRDGSNDMTGRLTIDYSNDVNLTGVSGGLIIGGTGTGQHLALDGNEIQSKVDATHTGTLSLQYEGGDTQFGGNIVLSGTVDGVDVSAHDGGAVESYHDVSGLDWGDMAIAPGDINLDDITPANATLEMSGHNIEMGEGGTDAKGTIYTETTSGGNWALRYSSNGLESGTLYDFGLFWEDNAGTTVLALQGEDQLQLGVAANPDVIYLDTDDVFFTAEINMSGNAIKNPGNVDGVDVSALKTDVDGFPDDLKDLTSDEITELKNINSAAISNTEWGYLANMDQGVATTNLPTFNGLTLNGALNAGNNSITCSKVTINDDGDNEGYMGPSNAWGLHHPTSSQGGYDAVEITIDDNFQIRNGSSEIFEVTTAGNVTTQGTTLQIGSAGTLEYNQTTPSGSNVLGYNGYFYANRVYNAVYNDYADFWETEDELVYGKCYSITKEGKMEITSQRADKACIGIATDTYGIGVGSRVEEIEKVPISVAGFVLAYCEGDLEPGDLLVPNARGNLVKAKFYEKTKAVAKYMTKEKKQQYQDVEVNGRHWVKVL